jgi:hypothetical protein
MDAEADLIACLHIEHGNRHVIANANNFADSSTQDQHPSHLLVSPFDCLEYARRVPLEAPNPTYGVNRAATIGRSSLSYVMQGRRPGIDSARGSLLKEET